MVSSVIEALRSRWVHASVASLLYWFTSHLLMAFVPIRMNALGASDLSIGGAVAARSVLPFLFALWAGQLSDRLGGQRLLIPSALLMAATGPLHAVSLAGWQFTLAQAVFGLATVGVWISLQAVITHAGAGQTLRNNLALFTLAWGIGLAVGPVAGALIYESLGFAVLCWVFATMSLLIVVSAQWIPWDVAREAERTSVAAPFRTAVAGLLGRPAIRSVLLSSFVTHYINSIRTSFYPVILERQGITVSQIGVLLFVTGAISLLIRALLPALLRAYRPGPVLVVSTVVGVVGITATPALPGMILLSVAAVAIGCSLGINPPVTVELMARFTTPTERGVSAGLRVTVNRLAQFVQPVMFGGAASVVGLVAAFPASGVVLGGLTWAMARTTRSVRVPED